MRRWQAFVVVFLVSSGPAWTDDATDAEHSAPGTEEHDHDHGTAEHGHEHGEGESHGHGHHLIHGDPPNTYFGEGTEFLYVSPKLFVWTLLLFLPLWAVLRVFVWKPLLASVEKRDQMIADSLTAAQKAREEAQRLADEQDATLGDAYAEARAIIGQVRQEVTAETGSMIAEVQKDMADQQAKARQEIESASKEGVRDLDRAAERLAANMASNLVGRELPPDAFQGNGGVHS